MLCLLQPLSSWWIGQYSSWLGHHQETLQNCVHLCINALSNPELIQSASIALKELTMENRMHMSKYLNDIFPIIKVKNLNQSERTAFTLLLPSLVLVDCAGECPCATEWSHSLRGHYWLHSLGISIEDCHRSSEHTSRSRSEQITRLSIRHIFRSGSSEDQTHKIIMFLCPSI